MPKSIVVTSEHFDQWWRDCGQFLPPADVATGEDLERLRTFANSMFKDHFQNLEDKISNLESDAESAEEDARKAMDDFKKSISTALESKSPLEEIKKLLK